MHTGKLDVNAYRFVALTIAFPILNEGKVEYTMFPFAMWMYGENDKTKLKLVYAMASQALGLFDSQQKIILACG